MEVFDLPQPYYPSETLSLEELACWIAFSRVRGIGPVNFKKLLAAFQDQATLAWNASDLALAHAGLGPRLRASFLQQRARIEPARELERLQKLRIRIITIKDPQYPPSLKKLADAPAILYTCGQLTQEDQFALAIVGTRRMSTYGRQVTERFASELARNGVTIISGLALGVDTAAHNAAMDAGGRTLAILASGLDIIYPSENRSLARRIVESGRGALISEFPLGVPPESGSFPARNRIISGLSLGVLVAEAPERSGALITAQFALNQGRDVFAVPGNMFSGGSGGVNKLIQDGARLVTSVGDILEALNLFMIPQCVEMQTILPANPEEARLLEFISHEPCQIDDLIRASELPSTTVSATLAMMELKGMIKQLGGMQFILAR